MTKQCCNGYKSIGFFSLLIVVFGCGAFAGSYWLGSETESPAFLPEVLNADSSGGKFLSFATGPVSESGDLDALFALDHLTGTLYCWILDPRNPSRLSAQYEYNVRNDLAVDGKDGDADYVMVTGNIDFSGGRQGNLRPANTVVYVGEGNSGKLAAYTFFYSRSSSAVQGGSLERLTVGQTRAASAQRDQ